MLKAYTGAFQYAKSTPHGFLYLIKDNCRCFKNFEQEHKEVEADLPYQNNEDNEIGGDRVNEQATATESINDDADNETSSNEENNQRITPTREVEANVIPDEPRRSGRIRREKTIFDPSHQ